MKDKFIHKTVRKETMKNQYAKIQVFYIFMCNELISFYTARTKGLKTSN